MFKSTNSPLTEIKFKSKNETGNEAENLQGGENKNKRIFIQDSKLNNSSEFNNKTEQQEEESDHILQNNLNDDYSDENKPKMTKEEVESLIDNKRSELDIKIYDLVTRNQVEEKKIEDAINNAEDEETKDNLVKRLEIAIQTNENNIALLKE